MNLQQIALKLASVAEVENDQVQLATYLITWIRRFNLWPVEESTATNNYLWIYVGISFLCILGTIGHLLKYTRETEYFAYEEICEDFPVLCAGLSAQLIIILVFTRIRGWRKLLFELGNFQRFEKPIGIELRDAFFCGLLRMYIWSFTAMLPFILLYLVTRDCAEEEDYSCGFVVATYLPGCMIKSTRPFCAVFTFSGINTICTISVLGTVLICQTCEYLVIYMQHLQTMLRTVVNIKDICHRRSYCRRMLHYHNRILELYDSFNGLAKNCFIHHIYITPITLAMSTNTFAAAFNFKIIPGAVAIVVTFLFVCMIGERIVTESEKVVGIAYESIPLDGDMETARDILLLIVRSQHSLCLPAGTITYCGHLLFAAVLQSTYSYFMMIKSF